jgi:biofilm PGA synthesis lipoprotein PgaB
MRHAMCFYSKKKMILPILIVLMVSPIALLLRLGYRDVSAFFQGQAEASVSRAGHLNANKHWPPSERLLGVQVLTLNCKNYDEVEQSIVNLREAGVNTLIVRAFQNHGDAFHHFARPRCRVGVYFETEHGEVVDPMLTRLVSIAHRHDLKVFAWMETRKMPLRLTNPEKARAVRYDFANKTFRTLPLWSIFAEEVQRNLVALYQDVARTGIDGILVQDDLVMYQYEDFSPEAVSMFEREAGRVLSPKTLYLSIFKGPKGRWFVRNYSYTFWRWSRWKNQKLLDLARNLIRATREVNPNIKFALNFMYESVTDRDNALAWLSQDIESAMRLPVDFYAIMAYHRQIKKELHLSDEETYEKITSMATRLLRMIDDPSKILMKIQVQDWDTRKHIPSIEIDEVLRRIDSQNKISLAFVPYSGRHSLEVISRYFQ